MNREDIIRMARESHLDVYGLGKDHEKFVSVVERFAALVAATEREECAKVCEEHAGTVSMFATSKDANTHNRAVKGCSSAIRARGQA